jgi:hypothetical protein
VLRVALLLTRAREQSNNDQDWSASKVEYTYYHIEVTKVWPTTGPQRGDREVTVAGRYFFEHDLFFCRFGTEAPRKATFRTASEVVCLSNTFPAALGTKVVEVAGNNQDFTAFGYTYEYQADVVITALSNTRGPAAGHSLVTVTGTNFVQSQYVRCMFGVEAVVGTARSSSEVLCYTPPVRNQTLGVDVSLNDQDYTVIGLAYRYRPNIVLTDFELAGGPAKGGTRVTVTGACVRACVRISVRECVSVTIECACARACPCCRQRVRERGVLPLRHAERRGGRGAQLDVDRVREPGGGGGERGVAGVHAERPGQHDVRPPLRVLLDRGARRTPGCAAQRRG